MFVYNDDMCDEKKKRELKRNKTCKVWEVFDVINKNKKKNETEKITNMHVTLKIKIENNEIYWMSNRQIVFQWSFQQTIIIWMFCFNDVNVCQINFSKWLHVCNDSRRLLKSWHYFFRWVKNFDDEYFIFDCRVCRKHVTFFIKRSMKNRLCCQCWQNDKCILNVWHFFFFSTQYVSDNYFQHAFFCVNIEFCDMLKVCIFVIVIVTKRKNVEDDQDWMSKWRVKSKNVFSLWFSVNDHRSIFLLQKR